MGKTLERALKVRRWLVIAMLGLLALAAIPANAAASSTYGWSLSCRGTDYGFGEASWEWTANGVTIANSSGYTYCSGDQKSSDSGLTRPDGADGLTVYLFAGYDSGGPTPGNYKYDFKAFKVGGSFSFKSSVSYTENGPFGKFQYTVSITLTG